MDVLEKERYPIGRFERPGGPLDASDRAALIGAIEALPASIRSMVTGLGDARLDTPYRAGGWTVRQVVHHVPDSHMNMYIRMKLAVTQDTPTVTAYDEVRWAELPDGRSAPVGMSLDLLDALHRRWVVFLRALSEDQFRRTFNHPEMGPIALYEGLASYAWHGRHHAAHIRHALSR